ncbi:MAG TPA: outer membrane protein assembly factor BamE [Pyrinomonadaceae bacterium]|nr:outer membrane protein assembly factor BamE [Pyrinomonadaceae bacterium]
MRYLRIPLGFLLLVLTFVIGVVGRDTLHERWLIENAKQIRPGMSESEVTTILGSPTSRHMSDITGVYWCYGSDSFQDRADYCGEVEIEMSSTRPGRVLKVLPIIP